LIVWLVLGYVIYMVVKGFMQNRDKQVPREKPLPGEETHRDPVCGVYVTEEDAVVGRIEEKRVYFCSMECLEKYRQQLEQK
jgi:YHS domain-containing protein